MKILHKDNVVTWHFNERYDFMAVREGLRRIRKKQKMYRFSVESFTNMFPVFDDDIMTRNFLYLSPTEENSRIGVDDKKRKLVFLLDEEAMRKFGELETIEREEFTVIDLGTVALSGDEGTVETFVSLRLMNDYNGVIIHDIAIPKEEWLEQIVLLEEGVNDDN